MNDTPRDSASGKGTILRAQNGDVIAYDETGLVLRLSDRVIEDIARRMGVRSAPATETVDADILGDIDAWNLRRSGDWHIFSANLPGDQGLRQYRRLAASESPDQTTGIIADAPGALLGILTLGGSRAATAIPRQPRFPWHITAPADDIGAAGLGGSGTASVASHLQNLREVTRDALLAEVLLADRLAHKRAMPLYLVRAETDGAASAAALSGGLAMANLLAAARSLKASAERLAKPARILCIRLDYGPEDVQSDPTAFRDGMLAIMDKLTAELGTLGFHKPLFIANPDSTADAALRGWWELGWNHAGHDLILPAPRYMFAHDEYARPTPEGMALMAEMDALALTAIYEDRPWFCPNFLLAEREGDLAIRVRARALTALVLQGDHGFSLRGTDAQIVGAAIAGDDAQDVILTLDRPPEGRVEVIYDNGSIRDEWSAQVAAGILRRFALPCALPLH